MDLTPYYGISHRERRMMLLAEACRGVVLPYHTVIVVMVMVVGRLLRYRTACRLPREVQVAGRKDTACGKDMAGTVLAGKVADEGAAPQKSYHTIVRPQIERSPAFHVHQLAPLRSSRSR